jgi:hypothetical protein
MPNLSIATCPNLADKLLQSYFPATAVQQDLLSVLSNPRYESLCSCLPSPDLAKDVFFSISLLTEDDFKAIDCRTLNHLYRKTMQLVHPDKNSAPDQRRALTAFITLNNARDTLGCRKSSFCETEAEKSASRDTYDLARKPSLIANAKNGDKNAMNSLEEYWSNNNPIFDETDEEKAAIKDAYDLARKLSFSANAKNDDESAMESRVVAAAAILCLVTAMWTREFAHEPLVIAWMFQ